MTTGTGNWSGRCAEDPGFGVLGLGTLPGVPTSHTDVMIVKGSGRRTFFHHQGANAKLVPSQFDFSRTEARILHLGAPGLHEAMDQPTDSGNGFTQVLERARAAGLRTNLEMVTLLPERALALVRPCLPLLDTIVINELEAAALSEVATHRAGVPDFDGVEAAARRRWNLASPSLPSSTSPRGAWPPHRAGGFSATDSVRVPPADIRSSNGAGDAFAAGVMLGIHEGWPVEALPRGGRVRGCGQPGCLQHLGCHPAD